MMPGIDPTRSDPSREKFYVVEAEMAKIGDLRQSHRVGGIGADELCSR